MTQPELTILNARIPALELTDRARVRAASRHVVGRVQPAAERATVLLLQALNGEKTDRDLWMVYPAVRAALVPWVRRARPTAPREVVILRVIVQEDAPGLADVAVIAQHGGLVRVVTWKFEAIIRPAKEYHRMWWEAVEVGF